MAGPALIKMLHVHKYYGRTMALWDISCRIEPGAFVFVTGPSGAGKSTLINLLACVERPSQGRITIGPVDDLGEASVTGLPGAALPWAHVLLVNLNSTHQAHTTSDADGSFSARIYAPPGSAVMIKHGPASERWNDLDVGVAEGINPFPGTIINLPHTHTGSQYEQPFAAAGAIDYFADDLNTTLNYVGSAWAITGTVGPVIVEGQWTHVLTGTYGGDVVPSLYLGGLN